MISTISTINPCTVHVGTTDIKLMSEVRNLGSWFDSNFSMSIHISKSCGNIQYTIQLIPAGCSCAPRSHMDCIVAARGTIVSFRFDFV